MSHNHNKNPKGRNRNVTSHIQVRSKVSENVPSESLISQNKKENYLMGISPYTCRAERLKWRGKSSLKNKQRKWTSITNEDR